MIDALERRHGLEMRLEAWPAGKDVVLDARDDLGHLNLRGDPDDAGFRGAAEKVLGQPLPVTPNTITQGDVTILWLGPDEWLILAGAGATAHLAQSLETALHGIHFAVNVVSGGQIALSISGKRVRRVLAKGCTLDLHPKVFGRGMCAQSGLARTNVTIASIGNDEEFLVIVRRSFADYLVGWLENAA